MKRLITPFSAAAALFAVVSMPVMALTVPVAEDTSSTPAHNLTPATGTAGSLAVNGTQTAFIRFDLGDPAFVPPAIQPGNVLSATLKLYVSRAAPAGDLTVHAITTDWSEKITGKSAQLPVVSPTVLATIHAADVVTKHFVAVDMTAAVKSALSANGNDFGFAIQAAAPTKVLLGSKEGTGTGYAAELDIEANLAENGSGNVAVTGTFSVSSIFTVEPRPNNTGTANIFIGTNAGQFNTSGQGNTFVGQNSGMANNVGSSNSFFGLNAGSGNTTGSLNSFFGQGAGAFNTTGGDNNFFGQAAGFQNTTGSANNYFGFHAGFSNTTGSNNTFFGDQAGISNVASFNTFVGGSAGAANTFGGSNVFVGYGAGASNLVGSQDSYFGLNAGNVSTASFNSFFGAGAGQHDTTGFGNSAFGNIAGFLVTTGSNNTFLGGNSGGSITTESKNTFVGDSADGAAGITNSTAIGQGAKVTVSNAVVLGNNCSVGIGTSAPNSMLQVNGSLSLPVKTVVSSSLVGLGDSDYVLINTGTAATTIILPQPGIAGRIFVVKNRASQAATLAFQSGGASIDGAASLSIATNAVVQVICDGTNWYKIN